MAAGGGPTNAMPAAVAGFGECGVFGQESIAGVYRIRARVARGRDDRIGIQVGLARGRGPDGSRLVGEAHVHRVAIGIRMHRDRVDAEPAAGPDHAAGDLAAVGDEQAA